MQEKYLDFLDLKTKRFTDKFEECTAGTHCEQVVFFPVESD